MAKVGLLLAIHWHYLHLQCACLSQKHLALFSDLLHFLKHFEFLHHFLPKRYVLGWNVNYSNKTSIFEIGNASYVFLDTSYKYKVENKEILEDFKINMKCLYHWKT